MAERVDEVAVEPIVHDDGAIEELAVLLEEVCFGSLYSSQSHCEIGQTQLDNELEQTSERAPESPIAARIIELER